MCGDKNQLHTTNEIGDCHNHKGDMTKRDNDCGTCRQPVRIIGRQLQRRFFIDPTGYPGSGYYQQRNYGEANQAHTPVIKGLKKLPQRSSHDGAN